MSLQFESFFIYRSETASHQQPARIKASQNPPCAYTPEIQDEKESVCNMPLVALATSGAFALGRSASDKRARKQEDRESQRGLPPIPGMDRKGASYYFDQSEQHAG